MPHPLEKREGSQAPESRPHLWVVSPGIPLSPPPPRVSSQTGSKPPDLLSSAASASPSCSFSSGSSLHFLRGGQQTPHQQVRILPASSGTSSRHTLLWPPHHPCAASSALQCGLRPTAPSSPTPHLPPASSWPRFLKAVCALFPFYLPPVLQLWPGFSAPTTLLTPSLLSSTNIFQS